MKLKPVTVINRSPRPVLARLTATPQRPQQATAHAYQILVTRHGVPPEKAKQLLGL